MLGRRTYFYVAMLLLLAGVQGVFAQQKLRFSVTDFDYDAFDTTAKDDRHKKVDGSGSLYAIIKVTSNSPNDNLNEYNFNFGNMNSFVEDHDDQLWVYVQKNAKMVTISRNGYTTLRNYDLHTTIEAGKTYKMVLSVQGPVVYTQMLMFKVSPADSKAVVTIKGSESGAVDQMLGNVDASGAIAKNLPFGTYTYRIFSENYYPTEGRITLNDKSQTYIENVTLRPRFSVITLNVASDAEIYVNGERKGQRTWSGQLNAGVYQVECRQQNHRSSSQSITVEENKPQTITLAAPTPITGTLSILSNPLGANIEIDGQDYGPTPRNIDDILIGKHTLVLTHQGYNSEQAIVEIKESQTSEVNIAMHDIPVPNANTAKTTISPTSTTMSLSAGKTDVSRYSFRKVGKCPVSDILNPMDGGAILGWTTVDEMVNAGGIKNNASYGGQNVKINRRTYWDHNGDGIIKSLYFTYSNDLPDTWKKAGLSFSMSYIEWMDWLKQHSFVITVAEWKNGKIINSKMEAYDYNHDLLIELDFSYNGNSTTKKGTLYSISLSRKRIKTSTTDYGSYFPIDGVTPGVTSANQMRQMGIDVNGSRGEIGEHSFWLGSRNTNIVDHVTIYENKLPLEWTSGAVIIMTYNKWIKFFKDNGFIITKNEPETEPNASYPKLRAINPEVGIKIYVSFRKSFSISVDGDNPDVVWQYDVNVL